MISAESFSERRFPDYGSWLAAFYLVAVVAGFFSVLANSRMQDGRLLDLTNVLLLQPLFALLAVALLAAVLAAFTRQSVKAILQAVTPWLPLLIAASIVNWGIASLGLRIAPQLVNLGGAALAFVTAGLLPYPVASVGTIALLVFAVVLVYRTIVRIRNNKKIAIAAAASLYASSLLVLLAPSVLGWFGLSDLSPLSAGALSVRRGLVLLANNGYWWNNLYDRFPFALGGEAELGSRLLVGALAYLVIAAVAACLAWRAARFSRTLWWRHVRGESFFLPYVLALFGLALAAGQGGVLVWKYSQLLAFIILLLVLFFGWMFAVGLNHKHDLAADARRGADHPLATGELAAAHLDEANVLFLVFGVMGAAILGWPVLYPFLAFAAMRALYDLPSLRLKRIFPINALLLGGSDLAILLTGWFFGMQSADLSKAPTGLLAGLFLSLAALSVLKDVKDAEGDGGVVPRRVIRAVSVALAAGYLILPLLAGWFRWYAVALPIALATVFFAFSKPFSERALRRLLFVFFAVSALLAASGWLIPV